MKLLKTIFCAAIPFFCVIALWLKLNGVDHIEFGDGYYRFMSQVLQNSVAFQIEIPSIPELPPIGNGFLDIMIGFVNGLISIINIIIIMFNVVIKLLSFILGLATTIIDSIKSIFIENTPILSFSI